MPKSDFASSVEEIKKGGVVGMPTETVYGLAASINSKAGIEKIFSTKERPFFDPLIVHVANLAQVDLVAREMPFMARILAKAFWPGPLTLILSKLDTLNPMITSGLMHVGVRMPNHPLALKLIEACGPLAAPSANKFKKVSPTTAEHVLSEFNDNVLVLDGGSAAIGIESTVIGFNGDEVKIYRPGMISARDIEKVLKDAGVKPIVSYTASPVAPGQLEHHYMPRVPLLIIKEQKDLKDQSMNPKELILSENAAVAARNLYADMRRLCDEGADLIYVVKKKNHDEDQWQGIWDRLTKASFHK